jgi:hypothetical protein
VHLSYTRQEATKRASSTLLIRYPLRSTICNSQVKVIKSNFF